MQAAPTTSRRSFAGIILSMVSICPMDFLPDMEQAGLMVTLGRWILDEVCRQIAEWQRTYDGTVNVSVNLSHGEFSDVGLAAAHPRLPSPLRSGAGQPDAGDHRGPDHAQARHRPRHHRRAPCGRDRCADRRLRHRHVVAARVHRFPVHGLKIDRSFIHELDVDPRTTEARADHHRDGRGTRG